MLKSAVYLLCLGASIGCAGLLARSYARNRTRLLLWSAASFFFIAVNNLFVVIDLLVLPAVDLVPVRRAATFAAVAVLLFGFIWETE